jgi:hypothetical protein
VTLTGFIIRNGLAVDGGGIRLANASPWFVDCVISGKRASGNSGGLYCASGAPLLEHRRFIDNIAMQGGGAADTSALLDFWGATNPRFADLNSDGVINGIDVFVLFNAWGT